MFCTRCGANNLDTDQFCWSCNAPLTRPVAAQGKMSPPDITQQPYGSSQQQQPPQGFPHYSGYQDFSGAQGGYANQVSPQQSGASGRAIAAMIVSIASLALSLLGCCLPISIVVLPISIVGIVLGKMEMNAIGEGRAPQSGETMAKVGFYLGIVSAALSFLLFALTLLGILSSFVTR